MTNREFYTAVMAIENAPTDIVDFAAEAIAKMDAANEKRKEKAATTESKKAQENAPVKAAILEVLTHDAQPACDIAAVVGISVNKAASLLRQLNVAGAVVVSEIKVPKKGIVKGYALPVAD